MTAILYGRESCNSCKQAQTLLRKTSLDWRLEDAGNLDYSGAGEIPVLILEDGKWIIGFGAINQYIQEKEANEHI